MNSFHAEPAGLSSEDLIRALLDQSASDEDFRQLVLSNPATAVEELSGKAIPADLEIGFFDAQDYDFAFILPDPVSLEDEDLEAVSGGATSDDNFCAVDFDIIDDNDNCGIDFNLIDLD